MWLWICQTNWFEQKDLDVLWYTRVCRSGDYSEQRSWSFRRLLVSRHSHIRIANRKVSSTLFSQMWLTCPTSLLVVRAFHVSVQSSRWSSLKMFALSVAKLTICLLSFIHSSVLSFNLWLVRKITSNCSRRRSSSDVDAVLIYRLIFVNNSIKSYATTLNVSLQIRSGKSSSNHPVWIRSSHAQSLSRSWLYRCRIFTDHPDR